MKRRILIVSHALELGGAERSLIGLLDAIDPKGYQVDLFLLRHEGELLNEVPAHVNVLPQIPAYTVFARPIKTIFMEGHFLLTAVRLIGKIAALIYDKLHHYIDSAVALEYSHKYAVPFLPLIQPDVKYDLAISFLTPHYFVANKVNARKKIAWIHTDYNQVQVNISSEEKMWARYDFIASISDAAATNFINVFPKLKKKVVVIENILPQKLIERQAEETLTYNVLSKCGIRILSIGRYCRAKNFDNVPEICRRLLNMGLDIYWYIIGFGGDENLIKERISQMSVEDRVILLGKKDNPYPYIRECDLYVQPSRYEGKCVAVREAQMLNKPVIITHYPTAGSQVDDGIDGIIVPLDNVGCATEMKRLIEDKELMEQLVQNCKRRDYSNAQEVEKIYQLMEK